MLLASAGSFALSSAVQANEWTFAPYVGSSEQFTDNVLGTSSSEESDFVTTLETGFTLTGETLRTELSISYDLSQDYYKRHHELDGYRQNFVSTGTVELLAEHFFLDARLTFTEETLDGTGAVSAGERTQASDRTQVFNGEISPYYVQQFGSWATGIARYSHSETFFSEPNTGGTSDEPADRSTDEYQLSLNSGTRFANVKWLWDNALISSESDDDDNFEHLYSIVTTEIPINRLFSVLATVGYDDFDVDDIDSDDISGAFAGAGVRFHPNTRTDISLQVGQRFGDTVYDMEASYAPTSLDTITASYKVSVETADQSLLSTEILDAQGELNRPDFTVSNYVDEVSKRKDFTFGWVGTRGRNSYGLSGSMIDREFLIDGTDEKVVSLNANFGRQLSPRAELSTKVGYTEVLDSQIGDNGDTTYSLGASYTYQIGNGLTGTASYDYLESDEGIGGIVRENAITLSIRKNF